MKIYTTVEKTNKELIFHAGGVMLFYVENGYIYIYTKKTR